MTEHSQFIDLALLKSGALLLIAIYASKASNRLGVPALLAFLAMGMLAGDEGVGGIPFDDARLTQSLGVVSLAFILFAGGLDMNGPSALAVLWRGISLSTVGVAATGGLVGLFAAHVLGLNWREGLLLGAIVSSTDAAAVFSVLRGTSLKGRIRPLLELESGSNDPMAAFLTVGLISLVQDPAFSPLKLLWMFVLEMVVGAIVGVVLGKLVVQLINRVRLESDGLYPVLSIAVVMLTYGVSTTLYGSGFLAVYIAGIIIGNAEMVHKRSILRFHDGIAWLMQIGMFLVLGLLVHPVRLLPVALPSIAIALFLIFVARPVAVFLSLAASSMPPRSKAMVAWVGLRGAVPIILATFPLVAGVKNADLYFNVVFFIVLGSVLLQGTSLPAVGRWLGVSSPAAQKRDYPLELVPTRPSSSETIELTIPGDSPAAGRMIMELHLPKSALVMVILRHEQTLIPRGATVLQGGDSVMILAEKDEADKVRRLLGAPSTEHADAAE